MTATVAPLDPDTAPAPDMPILDAIAHQGRIRFVPKDHPASLGAFNLTAGAQATLRASLGPYAVVAGGVS